VQNVLARRFPLVELFLAPASVQGEDAPDQICSALRRADRVRPDIILLVRGGGSIEDLWAFNDERVVRATAAAHAPVITGVGHETDYTLVDFAADLRAPTPSAAAELASPDREELRQEIERQIQRMAAVAGSDLQEKRVHLKSFEVRLRAMSPLGRLQNIRQQIDDHARRAELAVVNRIALNRTLVAGIVRVLDGVNPRRVLDRGYALVWRESDGKLVRSTVQAPEGMMLRLQVADGRIRAKSEGAIRASAEDAFPPPAQPSSPRREDHVA
jgi:exodeoxyribonuclease VII large subunit